MTDPQLIQLLQDKNPEELSFKEIELLRERLRHSAELRDTLLHQLKMEEYITQALGRVAVSADEIYAAAAVHTAGRQRLFTILGWTGSLGLGIAVLLWIALANTDRREPVGRSVPASGVGPPRIATNEPPRDDGVVPGTTVPNPAADPAVASTEKPAATPDPSATPPTVPAVGTPAVKPAPPAPAVAGPVGDEWPELSAKAPRHPFTTAAFDDADGALRGISKNQLSRWFTPVPGQNHAFAESQRGNVMVASFDGLIRLRAPWPADTVLSFAPFDQHTLGIYFWNGQSGVSLHYYQHPRPTWVAYRTTRVGAEPRPATFSLVATDSDRYDRSLASAVEIRHQAGSLVLSRGDLRLVTALLETPPTEVYFDKHAVFRTFTMYRGEPFPEEPRAVARNILGDKSPSARDWKKQLAAGAQLTAVGEGAMQLAADKGAPVSWGSVKVPRQGLYEVVFRLGEMSPGTGLFLGDETGKPVLVLGVQRDQRTGMNVLNFMPPAGGPFDTSLDLNVQPVFYASSGQWVRLVSGSGTLKCWVSGDGRHWSRALDPARSVRGGWSRVGLITFQTNDPHRITLEQLRVSELPAISALADDELVAQVPANLAASDEPIAEWQKRVAASRPKDTDLATWRAACAIRTLAAGSAEAANPQSNADKVWIDDELPAGAVPEGDTPWKFISKPNGPVFSGQKSVVRTAAGTSQHFFMGANPGLRVGEGDKLFAYVYLDRDQPPKEIMMQWNDSAWEHRAYWGEDVIPWGTPNAPNRLPMGKLPPPGEWVRLEVEAASVGLKPGNVITGWSFAQHGGTVYWDRAGITTQAVRLAETAGPSARLGNAILDSLLEDNLIRKASPADRLRVIDQAAELYDAWEQPDSYRLSQFYERLGKQLLREGDREPWSKVGHALFTAPIWTNALFQTVPESLANAEILFRVYDDQWDEVRQLCRRLKYFNRPAYPEQNWPDNRLRTRLLVEWAAANAERALGDKRKAGQGSAPAALSWQHPLAVSLSKEGFNTLAELEATLGDQSYRDACQIILGVKPELVLGLLPDGHDPRLMLSLPQAVDTAMRDYPGLRQTMVEQFGTLGRLRLQQALADASPHLLQALAVQFFGTSSAAAAHQWLGDRALADGDFAEAAAEFEIALHSAEPEQKAPLAARLRLAGAMLGRDEGAKVTTPVVFQNARLTAEAFERLVAEMKTHAVAVGGAPLVATEAAPPVGVKPVRYDVHGRGAIPGDVGLNPGNPLSGDVDWAARQTGCTVAGKMLYVSNRFQVSAYNLVTGKQHWSVPLGKEPAPTHSWGLVAMQPVVVGDRLFVRRLTKTGPELVCFNAVNGKIRWTSNPNISLASDPLILQDRLYIFTVATPIDDGLLSLDLSLVNPLSGEIISQQPVIQLRNLWERQLNCQASVVGARLVAVVGGTALCCDFTGKPLWVRRQIWIPAAQAPAGNEQSAGPPLVVGNRLFVSQPGVFAVECLDLDTGRRVWQQPLPDIRRLIGATGECLVAETARGWQAFATGTGKPLWQHDAEQVLDANVCPTTGDLLVAKREPQANNAWRPVLVWLNSMTGREIARLPLETLTDPQPMLGPIVVSSDRLWTLFGRGLREPRRELFELTPTAEPAHPPRVTAARP